MHDLYFASYNSIQMHAGKVFNLYYQNSLKKATTVFFLRL